MGGSSKIRLGSKAISFLQEAKGSRTLENLTTSRGTSISSVQRVLGGETVLRKTVLALMNSLGVSKSLDELLAMDSSEVESLEEEKTAPELQTYLEQRCREMLVPVTELTTNPLTRPGFSLELDDIYVERGLQQLKAKPKRNSDSSTQSIQALAGEGDKITELTDQQFFAQVLEFSQSPTSKQRVAITGEAGVGKTTLLQKIAAKILKNNLGFPIWIRLSQLRDCPLRDRPLRDCPLRDCPLRDCPLRDCPLSDYLLTVLRGTGNTNIKSKQLEAYLGEQCLEGRASSRILLKTISLNLANRYSSWHFN